MRAGREGIWASEAKKQKENGFRLMNMEWKNGLNGSQGVRKKMVSTLKYSSSSFQDHRWM